MVNRDIWHFAVLSVPPAKRRRSGWAIVRNGECLVQTEAIYGEARRTVYGERVQRYGKLCRINIVRRDGSGWDGEDRWC